MSTSWRYRPVFANNSSRNSHAMWIPSNIPERKVTPPEPLTPDVVAHRGQVRGLWKELMRIIADNHGRNFRYIGRDLLPLQLRELLRCVCPFISSVDANLNAVLEPYDDAALIELHGEDILDQFIRLASDAWWNDLWFRMLEISASGRSAVAFHRLFSLCPEGFRSHQQNIVHLLHRVTTDGNNTEVLSTLLGVDGVLPLPLGTGLDLLENAVRGGSLEVMSALLAVDSILSQVRRVHDGHGRAILPWTIERGNRSMVGALIKAGAPLECRSRLGGTPLVTAVASGCDGAPGIARDLLDAGADVNNSAGYYLLTYDLRHYGNTPLSIAVSRNNEDMMDLLLAAGADLGKERVGFPPLHAAACQDHCGAMKRLILAGASVHQLDSGGRSALHMACLHNCERAVKLLLRYNACMTLLCDEGLSPFDVVAIALLNRRQDGFYYGGRRGPSTLNARETSVADRIHHLLRRASRWGRRGWLVLMRHRIAHDLLDSGSSSPPPSFVESALGGQTATPHDTKTKEDANDGGCEVGRGEGIDVAVASPRGMAPSETFEGRTGHAFTPEAPMVDSSSPNGGRKVQACDVMRGAVEWLVQCPDAVDVFRETLAFL